MWPYNNAIVLHVTTIPWYFTIMWVTKLQLSIFDTMATICPFVHLFTMCSLSVHYWHHEKQCKFPYQHHTTVMLFLQGCAGQICIRICIRFCPNILRYLQSKCENICMNETSPRMLRVVINVSSRVFKPYFPASPRPRSCFHSSESEVLGLPEASSSRWSRPGNVFEPPRSHFCLHKSSLHLWHAKAAESPPNTTTHPPTHH